MVITFKTKKKKKDVSNGSRTKIHDLIGISKYWALLERLGSTEK